MKLYVVSALTTRKMAGVPALSMPYGVDKENMPVGVQLITNVLEEQKLLNFAYALEQAK